MSDLRKNLEDAKAHQMKLTLEHITPFWANAQSRPAFLSRTTTRYAQMPLAEALDARGIDNRLFTSLCFALPKGAYIAGGFMTSLMQEDKQASDVDMFFNSEKAFKDTFNLLAGEADDLEDDAWAWRGYKLSLDASLGQEIKGNLAEFRYVKFVHEGQRPPIQLIKLVWYDGPEHVIDSFDLTIAQFATDGENLFMNPIAPLDLARKRIVLHRMQFPASTLRRLIKYTQKGYYACPGSLTKIANEVAATIAVDPSTNDKIVYVD